MQTPDAAPITITCVACGRLNSTPDRYGNNVCKRCDDLLQRSTLYPKKPDMKAQARAVALLDELARIEREKNA